MEYTIQATEEQLDKLGELGGDIDERVQQAFAVGVSTLVQRKNSQVKQSENMKVARKAAAYCKAHGVVLS